MACLHRALALIGMRYGFIASLAVFVVAVILVQCLDSQADSLRKPKRQTYRKLYLSPDFESPYILSSHSLDIFCKLSVQTIKLTICQFLSSCLYSSYRTVFMSRPVSIISFILC